MRTLVEDRWLFFLLPFIFFCAAKPLLYLQKMLHSKTKHFWVITLILLVVVAYFQLSHANGLINNKKNTYSQVQEAAEWLKEHYSRDTVLLATSIPQIRYYGELKVLSFPHINTLEETTVFLNKENVTLLEISAFEQTPELMQKWIENNSNKLQPVYAAFSDPQKTQPILVIYNRVS
jgi:hypothetical protein